MLIHTAGPRGLAFFVSESEIKAQKDELGFLGGVARRAFFERGIRAKHLELETFILGSCVICFARAMEEGVLVFSFACASDAAGASRELARLGVFPATLLKRRGRYYLKVEISGRLMEFAGSILGEFGRHERADRGFCAHLSETGETIIGAGAMEILTAFW